MTTSFTDDTLYANGDSFDQAFAPGDEMRAVEIEAAVTTGSTNFAGLDITIEKADGSVVNAHMFNNTRWEYESALNEAPITRVNVVNTDVNDTRILVNVVSRK